MVIVLSFARMHVIRHSILFSVLHARVLPCFPNREGETYLSHIICFVFSWRFGFFSIAPYNRFFSEAPRIFYAV